MEVEIMSKLVKPSIPTPPTLQNFKISFTDELAPTIYVPLILYYPAPPKPDIISTKLETSLSETLSHFYPLSGRFTRRDALVDCSDQGVEYVQGRANFRLSEILDLRGDSLANVVNEFLPCEIGKADEVDDPMLSVKVTTFKCGGLALGMCFSHRLSDMSTMCNFINYWAATNRGEKAVLEKYSPVFNASSYFPCRGLPELDLRVPRSSIGVKNAARRFLFKGKSISALREKVGYDGIGKRRPSKVQLVVAFLWKALIRIDQEKNGRSKASFLIQPVGLRDKVAPPIPENSCGNFWGLATSRLGRGEGDNIDFIGLFELLRNSIKKIAIDCSKVLTHGEEGYGIVINPYLEANRNIADSDVNFYLFTCWCKFSFYKADFGWGTPVWASTGKLPVQNLVIMLDDEEGDGVEAWVHMDEKVMAELEQHPDVKAYAII